MDAPRRVITGNSIKITVEWIMMKLEIILVIQKEAKLNREISHPDVRHRIFAHFIVHKNPQTIVRRIIKLFIKYGAVNE